MSDSDWVSVKSKNDDSDWVSTNAPSDESLARRLTRSTLDTVLPVGGAIGAGLLATPETAGLATIPAAAAGYASGKQLSRILKNAILGDDVGATDLSGLAKQTAGDLGNGAVMEMGGQVAGAALAPVGKALGNAAEKLAVNATGATGKQAAEFAPDAGRQLLDRGLVKFGDNAGNIAQRTESAMGSANSDIDSALKALDAKGVNVSADNIVSGLQSKITQLEKDPSQAGLVRKLKTIVDDIYQTGESNVPLSAAEQTKRGFNKAAGNWMDPEAGQAGKEAYSAYKNAVEETANAADPALADKFAQGKQTYGLLAPINEAAERRAMTVNQAPMGGLGDMVAAGAGAGLGGAPGAIAGVASKKFLAPRVSSSLAVGADNISKILLKSPQMQQLAETNPTAFGTLVRTMGNHLDESSVGSQLPRAADQQQDASKSFDQSYGKDALVQKTQGTKYAQVLQNAAQRGGHSVAAVNFVLQQQDPDYRKLTLGQED